VKSEPDAPQGGKENECQNDEEWRAQQEIGQALLLLSQGGRRSKEKLTELQTGGLFYEPDGVLLVLHPFCGFTERAGINAAPVGIIRNHFHAPLAQPSNETLFEMFEDNDLHS